MLLNFVLHLFAATQTPNKIYEVGLETSSTGFISETVKAQEAYSQKKNKKAAQLREEVTWKLNNKWKFPEDIFINKQQPNKDQQPQRNQQPYHTQQIPQRTQPPYAQQQQSNVKRILACFKYGKTDHLRSTCPNCPRCGKRKDDANHPGVDDN